MRTFVAGCGRTPPRRSATRTSSRA